MRKEIESQASPTDSGVSRRRFLGYLGGAAGLAAGATGLGPTSGTAVALPQAGPAPGPGSAQPFRYRPALQTPQTFGRMFGTLPAFAQPGPALTEALQDIGRPGGVMDAGDDLSVGPVRLITEPGLSPRNRDNPRATAGVTFLGQFVDHDLTFDRSSRLGVPTDPQRSRNERTPLLDLDSLYGGGPLLSAQLYQRADRAKLAIESGGRFEDLPRNPHTGQAVLADGRNDENLIIGGLTAALVLFHNAVVDRVRAERRITFWPLVFEEARRRVTHHYQWIVVTEFLPTIAGPDLVGQVMRRGRAFYRPVARPFTPVEFQGAAYRFGHSIVRPSYRANLAGDGGQPFFGFIFSPDGEGAADPVDLRGRARAPRRFVGWQTFFDFGDGQVRPNKRIDTHLSTPLFRLPLQAIPGGDRPTSLAQRNLLRHVTWSLPSGQAIAGAMAAPPLSAADLADLAGYGIGLERSTPLWYYVLKEAEVVEDGLQLGPVGGRIVTEVLLGVLDLDPKSFRRVRGWRPTLPDRSGRVTGRFTMVDLLTLAGVDPASRGQ